MILESTSIRAVKRFETLEKDFNRVHNHCYDYSKFVYVNARTNGIIICKEHGEFKQVSSNHLRGSKCPKCSRQLNSGQYKKDTTGETLNKFREVHGTRYDYTKATHINSSTKIDIVCRIHGDFKQTPKSHIQGAGCPKCGRITNATNRRGTNHSGGWTHTEWYNKGITSKDFEGFKLYVIECWSEDERFVKIGKTFRRLSHRYNGSVGMPYEWKVIEIVQGSAKYISNLETSTHSEFKKLKHVPSKSFKGMTECFDMEILETLKLQ